MYIICIHSKTNGLTLEYKFEKIIQNSIAKRSGYEVLDPTGIRIHNTAIINIFHFIFQVCTHAQLSLSQFHLPTSYFLHLLKPVILPPVCQPALLQARFTVSYFTVIFSNLPPSFYEASFSVVITGCSVF